MQPVFCDEADFLARAREAETSSTDLRPSRLFLRKK